MRDILLTLESIAPERWTFPFDKVGLQVGDSNASVTRALVSLDRSLGAVRCCRELGAELLLAHHPLIFTPLPKVTTDGHTSRTVLELLQSGVNFIAAHTNWDSAPGGVNDALAARLGLLDVTAFGSAATPSQLKLVVFAPHTAAEALIDALSDAGAGLIGTYRRCAFSSVGTGTFEAANDSSPTIGEPGARTHVEELRIEMVLPETKEGAVVRALRRSHSYETPAFDLIPLKPQAEQPAGRIGSLPEAVPLERFAEQVDNALSTRSWVWGERTKLVRRIAVVGGAADGDWIDAQRAKADVFVTGEVKQHIALEASESGLPILASGHYATEQPGVEWLRDRMAELVPSVDWVLYEPPLGLHGRPQ